MISKILLMSALLVGGTSVAYAQDAAPAPVAAAATTTTTTTTVDVPVCSRTVTDKCVNRTARTKTVVHRNHKTVKTTSKVTKTEG